MIAAFGDRINQTALLSIVVYVMGNTAKFSADIMFWAILPAVILGPFAVILIDRWDRQRTMVVSDSARAILALSLPILMFYVHHHYVIYAVVFLMGTFSALFAPSRLAIIPSLVPRELLMPANAIASQAGTVATLIAMPVGGWIVENCGRNMSFVINAITYLVSACLILALRPSQDKGFRSGIGRLHRPMEDLRLGLQFIWKAQAVFFYILFSGLTQCLVAIFFVCFFSYGVDILGQTVGGTNLLFGSLGLGMAGGALWLGRFSKFGERFLWPMMMLMGSGFGIFVLSKIYNPWLSAPMLFGIGFCAVMTMVPIDTFLQKHVPDEFRGRVFVVRGVLVGAAFLVSLQFSKAIIYRLGTLETLQLLGLGAFLLGLGSMGIGRFWIGANAERRNEEGGIKLGT